VKDAILIPISCTVLRAAIERYLQDIQDQAVAEYERAAEAEREAVRMWPLFRRLRGVRIPPAPHHEESLRLYQILPAIPTEGTCTIAADLALKLGLTPSRYVRSTVKWPVLNRKGW